MSRERSKTGELRQLMAWSSQLQLPTCLNQTGAGCSPGHPPRPRRPHGSQIQKARGSSHLPRQTREWSNSPPTSCHQRLYRSQAIERRRLSSYAPPRSQSRPTCQARPHLARVRRRTTGSPGLSRLTRAGQCLLVFRPATGSPGLSRYRLPRCREPHPRAIAP